MSRMAQTQQRRVKLRDLKTRRALRQLTHKCMCHTYYSERETRYCEQKKCKSRESKSVSFGGNSFDSSVSSPALIISLLQDLAYRRSFILHNEAAGRTLVTRLLNAFLQVYGTA